jgi:hypothetical protein
MENLAPSGHQIQLAKETVRRIQIVAGIWLNQIAMSFEPQQRPRRITLDPGPAARSRNPNDRRV